MSHKKDIPVNAIILTWLIGCGLALIPLGSTAAFINIQTIGNSGLLTSYITCVACRLHHRNSIGPHGKLPQPPPFFLGRTLGNVINTIAILFLFCFLISGMFPVAPNPTISSMNWSSLALGGTVLVAGLAYIVRGKKYLGAGVGATVELMDVNVDSKSFDRRL